MIKSRLSILMNTYFNIVSMITENTSSSCISYLRTELDWLRKRIEKELSDAE